MAQNRALDKDYLQSIVDQNNANVTDNRPDNEPTFFQRCSISQLQALARQSNVDLSMCVERSEMVQLLRDAGILGDGQQQQLSPQLLVLSN